MVSWWVSKYNVDQLQLAYSEYDDSGPQNFDEGSSSRTDTGQLAFLKSQKRRGPPSSPYAAVTIRHPSTASAEHPKQGRTSSSGLQVVREFEKFPVPASQMLTLTSSRVPVTILYESICRRTTGPICLSNSAIGSAFALAWFFLMSHSIALQRLQIFNNKVAKKTLKGNTAAI